MAVYTCIISSVNSNRRVLISVFALTDALRNLLFAIFKALNNLSRLKASEVEGIKLRKSWAKIGRPDPDRSDNLVPDTGACSPKIGLAGPARMPTSCREYFEPCL